MNYIKIFIIFFFITSCNTISPGINKNPSKSGFAPAKRLSKNFYSQTPIDVQNLSYKNINVKLHNINKMKIQAINSLNEDTSSYEKLPEVIADLLRYNYKYVIGA